MVLRSLGSLSGLASYVVLLFFSLYQFKGGCLSSRIFHWPVNFIARMDWGSLLVSSVFLIVGCNVFVKCFVI